MTVDNLEICDHWLVCKACLKDTGHTDQSGGPWFMDRKHGRNDKCSCPGMTVEKCYLMGEVLGNPALLAEFLENAKVSHG